jgi:hypothetical protein
VNNAKATDMQIPTQKHKKYEKKKGNTTPKVNNSTVADSNNSELNEISKNSKE